tara:strand:+ start:147 stop:413 length:267 start_codon:yes stop_codon:yes gene_type:complete
MTDSETNIQSLPPLPNQVTLNLQQGLLLHSIIDVISRRGGFLGDELRPVGELFEYVKNELKVEEHIKRAKIANDKSSPKQENLPPIVE